MGKIAFLFSGQGAQHPGMGKDLYENFSEVAGLFDKAEALRPGTLAQMFEGDEATLRDTANTQPCLYLADFAAALAAKSAGITPDMKLQKRPEGLKSFEYHNAHSYWAYAEVCEGVFGPEGKAISEKVFADFAKEYGQEMADILEKYKDTNFNMA